MKEGQRSEVDQTKEGREVLLVAVLPDLRGGGAQRVVLNLLRHMPKRRLRVLLVVLDSNDGKFEKELPGDIDVLFLGATRLRYAVVRLWKTFHEVRPSAAFSTFGHLNLLILLYRLLPGCRYKAIIREPNTPSKSLPSLAYSRFLRIGYLLFYRHADLVISQSSTIGRELEERYGVSPRRLKPLNNGVDSARLRSRAVPLCPRHLDVPLFVTIGSLTWQKGIDRLITMLAETEADFRLIIVGEGSMKPELERLTETLSLGEKIVFAGFIAEPWSILAAADALLLPSRWEGMPNVALESLALGVPVVASSDTDGLPELLEFVGAGSIQILPFGDEYRAAIERIVPWVGDSLRSSLLPPQFEVGHVAEDFEAMVHSLV